MLKILKQFIKIFKPISLKDYSEEELYKLLGGLYILSEFRFLKDSGYITIRSVRKELLNRINKKEKEAQND